MAVQTKEKVLLGFSGGVDSTAAALILKNAGFSVRALYLNMTGFDKSAELIASELDISFEMLDVRDDFQRYVADETVRQYAHGLTPNPCILCNRAIKWKFLFDYADSHGISKVASGHYARIVKRKGESFLARDPDKIRDQSYFMYRIDPDYLARMVLPLGNFTRQQSENLLEKNGFLKLISHKSRDLCFLSGEVKNSIDEYLRRRLEPVAGDLLYHDGRKIGQHKSLQSLTIGQRRGLGITWEHPLYVIDIDLANHRAILGPRIMLDKTEFFIENINLLADVPKKITRVLVKIRNTHQGTLGDVTCKDGKCLIQLDEPVSGITPGQSAVFYDDDIVLGGGIISKIEPK